MIAVSALLVMTGCGPNGESDGDTGVRIKFEVFALVEEKSLDEISGIEVVNGSEFVVFNDDGKPRLWLLNEQAELLQKITLSEGKNRDWEDITQIQRDDRTLLAIGDIGDNLGVRSSIRIYFIEWPVPEGSSEAELLHELKLNYPDGARDCESLAWDPVSDRLIFVTKRDKPPRVYSVDVGAALAEPELQLEYLGELAPLRPPTRDDMRRFGDDGQWVSQPTGMDISDDGRTAALITYRSLYLFERHPDQSWEEVFQTTPREFAGPASKSEEAIAFGPDSDALFISSEDRPAPIYRAPLPARDQKE